MKRKREKGVGILKMNKSSPEDIDMYSLRSLRIEEDGMMVSHFTVF